MLGNYTPEVLEKLHIFILDALKEFDRVCKKYGIVYFVGFGTAIGAVRHKGYIPWDDDIDVCMMREEYEKLHQIPAAEWRKGYFLADSRDNYRLHRTLYPCLYIEGTAFETELYYNYLKPNITESYPIHIDIFVFDAFKKERLNRMIKVTDNYKRMILYSSCKYKIIPTDNIIKILSCGIKRMMYHILKLTGWTSKKIYNSYLKYLNKNSGINTTCFELVETYQKITFVSSYDEMFPVVYIDFEDMKVPINKNYHEILTRMYGDYMAMPPMEKRWNAAPVVLDFGDGKGNVIQKESNHDYAL